VLCVVHSLDCAHTEVSAESLPLRVLLHDTTWLRAQGSWFMVYGFGFKVRIQGLGFRVKGSVFMVYGLLFRVQGLWFGVLGVGLTARCAKCLSRTIRLSQTTTRQTGAVHC